MTEPGSNTSGADDDAAFELDKVLDSLKRARGDADDTVVSSDASPRMSWSSVTEAEPRREPPAPPTANEPSFTFDLGSALARAGDPSADDAVANAAPAPAPAADPLPRRAAPAPDLPRREVTPTDPAPELGQTPTADLPRREATREPTPSVDPLPRRDVPAADSLPRREAPAIPAARTEPVEETLPRREAAAAPVARAVEPGRSTAAGQRSVFEGGNPAPTLPRNPQRAPGEVAQRPVLPATTAGALPTLPAANPAAPPPMVEASASSPAAPDIHAVRSFQLRAQRNQRRSKMFGRTLLALVFLAAAVAAALLFGRSVLFPTQWNAELTPIVDRIEQQRGDAFGDTVALQVLPTADYVPIALGASVGADWTDRMADWRALGVASGAETSELLNDAVVALRPAVYDPTTNTIYRAEPAEGPALDAALELALIDVYERQQGATPNAEVADVATGLPGASSPQQIVSRALDRALLSGSLAIPELDAAYQAPLPIVYELLAVDTLGQPLLQTAGAELAGARYGDTYPESVLTAPGVRINRAVAGVVPAGTEAAGEAVAFGNDGWSLVWRNRLPAATADRLADLVTSDSYRPYDRNGTRCFVATFQTATDAAGNEVLASLARWVTAAPAQAEATASLVSPTRLELRACDPGVAVAQTVDPSAATELVARQVARIPS